MSAFSEFSIPLIVIVSVGVILPVPVTVFVASTWFLTKPVIDKFCKFNSLLNSYFACVPL